MLYRLVLERNYLIIHCSLQSWDCPVNSPGGYSGFGQYSSLAVYMFVALFLGLWVQAVTLAG